jgi:hypothetical protein
VGSTERRQPSVIRPRFAKTFAKRNRIDRAVEFSEVDPFCNASLNALQKSIAGF